MVVAGAAGCFGELAEPQNINQGDLGGVMTRVLWKLAVVMGGRLYTCKPCTVLAVFVWVSLHSLGQEGMDAFFFD